MANRADIHKPTKKEFEKDLKNGESVKEMAEKYDVSTQTIRNWATDWGIYQELIGRSPLYRACKGKVKQVLSRMLKEDKSIADISKELHVAQKHVLDGIKEYDLTEAYEKLKFKHRSERRKEERDEKTEWWKKTLTECFDKGMSVNQICDELHCTKRTVYLRMRQVGLGKRIRKHNMLSRAEIAERKERIRQYVLGGEMTVAEISRKEDMKYANALRVINQIREEENIEIPQKRTRKTK